MDRLVAAGGRGAKQCKQASSRCVALQSSGETFILSPLLRRGQQTPQRNRGEGTHSITDESQLQMELQPRGEPANGWAIEAAAAALSAQVEANRRGRKKGGGLTQREQLRLQRTGLDTMWG